MSKELYHFAAILQNYAGSLIFTNHFYSEKFSKKNKIAQIYYYDPQSTEINVQLLQSESTPK